ncbi:hypothetical protein Tco_0850882 [Tanacetum coccineum]
MAELISKEYMEKAETKSNLSNTGNNINIELSKEFLTELQDNAYHGMHHEDVMDHIATVIEMLDLINIPDINEGAGKITTWEELVEKFFCKFYPESYDGEEEMLDEGDNWGIDPFEFISQVNSSFDNHKKVNGRTKKPYLKTQEKNNTEKEDVQGRMKRKSNGENLEANNTSNTINDERPNKRICNAEKFEAIKYSNGPNEEYIAIRRCEYNAWERNEISMFLYGVFQFMDTAYWSPVQFDLAESKEIDEVGEVSII